MRISDWSSDVCSSDLLGNGSGGRAVSLPRPQNLSPLHGVAVPPGTRRSVQLRTCSVRADQGWRSSIGILVSCRSPGPGQLFSIISSSHYRPRNTVATEDTRKMMNNDKEIGSELCREIVCKYM